MVQENTKKTIAFYTFGCRLNQSETAVIESGFQSPDYRTVNISQPADIVVINTCTVTENGDADTRYLVNKVNRLNPQVKIALVGCQAQIQKERLLDLSNVQWVVGNAKKFDLTAIIGRWGQDTQPQVIAPFIPRENFSIPLAATDRRHTRANLKIQDGCDFFCSFCEIPYARGRARSRDFANIINEAQILVKAGHQEVILTGINIGTYHDNDRDIADVISALEEIDGLKRIRISSIEPTTIPLKIIERMKRPSKLCRYLHIPLQSGDDVTLKRMQRKYSVTEFQGFVEYAHKTVPGICIGTDVIVGFPGETEVQFQATCDFLREAPIDYFHVFTYSKRYMAKSRLLTDEIPIPIKKKRSQTLRELSERKRRVFLESMLNTEQDVLFEEQKRGYWLGLTDNYMRIKISSPSNLYNSIRKVKLLHVAGPTIIGQLS